MFRLMMDEGHMSLRTEDLSLKIDGPMHKTAMMSLAAQYLGGDDLNAFNSIVEHFGHPGRIVIEYDDAPPKSLARSQT